MWLPAEDFKAEDFDVVISCCGCGSKLDGEKEAGQVKGFFPAYDLKVGVAQYDLNTNLKQTFAIFLNPGFYVAKHPTYDQIASYLPCLTITVDNSTAMVHSWGFMGVLRQIRGDPSLEVLLRTPHIAVEGVLLAGFVRFWGPNLI